jgi:NADH-quinone oxidoreductase subunit J
MISQFFFFVFAGASVLSALLVITRKSPVASVMFLIVTFFSLAGMFLLMDAPFIAAVQVIVYAGAIMVLFLFVIMLLNLGQPRASDVRGPLVMLVAGSLTVGLVLSAVKAAVVSGSPETDLAGPAVSCGFGPEAMQALVEANGAVGAIGGPLFRNYLVPFEITSLLLLVAMVGAIVLARSRAP